MRDNNNIIIIIIPNMFRNKDIRFSILYRVYIIYNITT